MTETPITIRTVRRPSERPRLKLPQRQSIAELDRTRWAVVQTEPRAERLAQLCLQSVGFMVARPTFQQQVVRIKRRSLGQQDGTVEVVERNTFPQYLFAWLGDGAPHWKRIWSGMGVQGVLCMAGEPALVPERAMELVLGELPLKRLMFRMKELVEVQSGPFRDNVGVVDSGVDESGRVRILLHVMGRRVRVMLDATQLRAV